MTVVPAGWGPSGRRFKSCLPDLPEALELIPDPSRSPQEAAELSEEVRELRGQFSRLKPQESRALSLLCLGYSYRDIGEITGWTHTKINGA